MYFFFRRYRKDTLENRFSSLTFPRPCPTLQSIPPVRFLLIRPHIMRKYTVLAVAAAFFLAGSPLLLAQSTLLSAVVFSEPGFPAADSAAPSSAQLAALFPGAQLAGVDHLQDALAAPATRLLILPYGSAFPEVAVVRRSSISWTAGGNLLGSRRAARSPAPPIAIAQRLAPPRLQRALHPAADDRPVPSPRRAPTACTSMPNAELPLASGQLSRGSVRSAP
jgi:hypothetical protein